MGVRTLNCYADKPDKVEFFTKQAILNIVGNFRQEMNDCGSSKI